MKIEEIESIKIEIPWKEESWSSDVNYRSSGIAFYRKLYETLRHGAPLAVPPEMVRRVMWIVEKCFKLCGI